MQSERQGEVEGEGDDVPVLKFGVASEVKKGEDMWITDVSAMGGEIRAFGVFDGHNGKEAAEHCRENLLENVMAAMPVRRGGESVDEQLSALQQAMLVGFVKADKDFVEKSKTSGTTATLVLVQQWTVTVAAVGDSRCVLDSFSNGVTDLTVDHRLEDNPAEVNRLELSGGKIGRICTASGVEVGPLRCWPGGLCLSRSIGDFDVGEFIVPVPHVRQLRLPTSGGRLIVASDGVWDAISSKRAAAVSRGLSAADAARRIVREAIRKRGLKDDTTCIVLDVSSKSAALLPPPRRGVLHFLRRRSRPSLADSASDDAPDEVEELFDDDSPHLLDRLTTVHGGQGIFLCAICRKDLLQTDTISVHAGGLFGPDGKLLAGRKMCNSCQAKASAMEGEHGSAVRGPSVMRQEVIARLGT